MFFVFFFFFFKQKTAYEIGVRLVGSEMCIRDSLRICPRRQLYYFYRLNCFSERDLCTKNLSAANFLMTSWYPTTPPVRLFRCEARVPESGIRTAASL